jgi:hypothetical protein
LSTYGSNLNSIFVIMSELFVDNLFVDNGLDSKLQHYGPCRIF